MKMNFLDKYNNYLDFHINCVKSAWLFIKENNIGDELLSEDNVKEINTLIRNHDKSKWDIKEYEPYASYFYGDNPNEERMNAAWLIHQNTNPHHWQYWVLIMDDPEDGKPYTCIKMPVPYVYEMICDWWSFSWKNGNLYNVFEWYNNHRKIIRLHPETRKLVEHILQQIRWNLDGSLTIPKPLPPSKDEEEYAKKDAELFEEFEKRLDEADKGFREAYSTRYCLTINSDKYSRKVMNDELSLKIIYRVEDILDENKTQYAWIDDNKVVHHYMATDEYAKSVLKK